MRFKDATGSGIVKDVDTKNRIVTGYLSRFGNKDSDGDIIEKGAYSRSIKNNFERLRFLNQHRWDQPHGPFQTLKEDAFGLYFESKPLIDTTYSEDAIKLYAAGIISEHSVGFQVVNGEYDEKQDAYIMRELRLFEGSNVTLGANSSTPFQGFKCESIKDADDKIKKIMKMLRTGTLTDDGFALLEIALKQLQLQSFELGKKTLNQSGPATPPANAVNPSTLIETINNFAQ